MINRVLLIFTIASLFAWSPESVKGDDVRTPTPERYRLLIDGTVTEVLAGDTFRLDSGVIVRLAGVSCYEPFNLGWVDELNPHRLKYANMARETAEKMVLDKILTFEIVNSYIPDIENRKQVYIYLDKDQTLNEHLLSLGLAQILPGTPNHPLSAEFKATQSEAVTNQAGMFSIDKSTIGADLPGLSNTASEIPGELHRQKQDNSPFSMYRKSDVQEHASADAAGKPQNMDSDDLTILFGSVILSSFFIGLIVSYYLAVATKKCKVCGAENGVTDEYCSACGQEFRMKHLLRGIFQKSSQQE